MDLGSLDRSQDPKARDPDFNQYTILWGPLGQGSQAPKYCILVEMGVLGPPGPDPWPRPLPGPPFQPIYNTLGPGPGPRTPGPGVLGPLLGHPEPLLAKRAPEPLRFDHSHRTSWASPDQPWPRPVQGPQKWVILDPFLTQKWVKNDPKNDPIFGVTFGVQNPMKCL